MHPTNMIMLYTHGTSSIVEAQVDHIHVQTRTNNLTWWVQRQLSRSWANAPEAASNIATDEGHDSLSGESSPQWCAPNSQATGRHSLDNAGMRNSDMYLPEASFRDGIASLLGSGSTMPNGHSL